MNRGQHRTDRHVRSGLTLAGIVQIVAVRQAPGPPGAVAALLDRHALENDLRIAELVSAQAVVQRLRERAAELDPAD